MAILDTVLDYAKNTSKVFHGKNLNARDRCDACSSQAYVHCKKNDLTLLFCGNHGRKHLKNLISQGWEIDDQTHKLFKSRLKD